MNRTKWERERQKNQILGKLKLELAVIHYALSVCSLYRQSPVKTPDLNTLK